MAAFLRPGEKRPGAFGVTFDLDAGSSQPVPVFNRNERLDLQEQRRRLPAFQHRCLHALLGLCRTLSHKQRVYVRARKCACKILMHSMPHEPECTDTAVLGPKTVSAPSCASGSSSAHPSLRHCTCACRREILYLVEHHATIVIVGETGSGKSTQIPQYLLEAGWCSGMPLLSTHVVVYS